MKVRQILEARAKGRDLDAYVRHIQRRVGTHEYECDDWFDPDEYSPEELERYDLSDPDFPVKKFHGDDLVWIDRGWNNNKEEVVFVVGPDMDARGS